MRLFAALVPAHEVVVDLERFLEPRQEAGSELRWTDPEQWHVTLAFMAQAPERIIDPLVTAVREAVVARAPFALRCAGGGAFPNPDSARVLWIGLESSEESGKALKALARGVRRACSHAGGAPAGGPFHPHVTVARTRRPLEATRWLRVLDGYAGPEWVAGEVTLIASHLGEGPRRRSRYERIASVPLVGPW